MKYKYVWAILVFSLISWGQEIPDSTHINRERKEMISDSSFQYELLNKIDDLSDSVSVIKKTTGEIRESNNESNSFYDITLRDVLIPIIVSLIMLIGQNIISEWRLKNKFKFLEGNYNHFANNEFKPNCSTEIKYKRGGKLQLDTKTDYGNWQARIVMDKDIPENGGGAFNYNNKDEGGFMNISVRDNNTLYVFPFTLTHREQKVNFYILKRKNT